MRERLREVSEMLATWIQVPRSRGRRGWQRTSSSRKAAAPFSTWCARARHSINQKVQAVKPPSFPLRPSKRRFVLIAVRPEYRSLDSRSIAFKVETNWSSVALQKRTSGMSSAAASSVSLPLYWTKAPSFLIPEIRHRYQRRSRHAPLPSSQKARPVSAWLPRRISAVEGDPAHQS